MSFTVRITVLTKIIKALPTVSLMGTATALVKTLRQRRQFLSMNPLFLVQQCAQVTKQKIKMNLNRLLIFLYFVKAEAHIRIFDKKANK